MYFLLNYFIFYLWLYVLIVFHELGHAVAARIAGFRVIAMSIGYGRNLYKGKVFGIPVEFNSRPFNGITFAFPDDLKNYKLRMWIVSAGGLAVHLAFISLYLAFAWSGFDDFLSGLIRGVGFAETFFVANVLHFVTNAFPYRVNSPQGALPSDGLQLILLPFIKTKEIEEVPRRRERLEAWVRLRDGRYDEARRIYESLLADDPENAMYRHDVAVIDLQSGHYERSREVFAGLLDSEPFREGPGRNLILNNIAWTDAIINRSDLIEEADRYSSEAVRSNPRFRNFLGTRGTVLIRLGKYRLGLDYLEDTYKKSTETRARSSNAAFIALGYANLGDGKAAAKWIGKAKTDDPDDPLIGRIESEIAALREPVQAIDSSGTP